MPSPFYAYLDSAAAPGRTTDVLLGEIQLVVVDGRVGVLDATLTFEVPDIEAGMWGFVYCNDPCTNGVGDLMGGEFNVRTQTLPFTGFPLGESLIVGTALLATGVLMNKASRQRPRTHAPLTPCPRQDSNLRTRLRRPTPNYLSHSPRKPWSEARAPTLRLGQAGCLNRLFCASTVCAWRRESR